MKPTYFLGLDAAKHKIRVALRGQGRAFPLRKDLPVSATGCRALLALLRQHLPQNESLLVLIEATGVLHCNWAAALTKARYSVAVINPLMAHRLYTLKNSIRENKTDPVDARGLLRPSPPSTAPTAPTKVSLHAPARAAGPATLGDRAQSGAPCAH